MSGQYLGLDRPAIESTLHLLQVPRRQHREMLLDLMVMEAAVLEYFQRDPARKK